MTCGILRAMKPDGQLEDPHRARDRVWARWALQRWDTFPVHFRPRPLVLTARPTWFEQGLRSKGAKLAFTYGDIETTVPLPDGLLEVLRRSESRPSGEPGKHRRWGGPLLITQANPSRAEFATDRGMCELPAWRLGGPEIGGALWVLDPAVVSRCWTPPESAPPKPFDGLPHRSAYATVESDALTLHFTFTGAPSEFTEYPEAETVETNQALVVLPVERGIGPAGPRPAVGCARTVIAKLANPLGERVVVDLDASPVIVEGTT
jgi:hypothetical protein